VFKSSLGQLELVQLFQIRLELKLELLSLPNLHENYCRTEQQFSTWSRWTTGGPPGIFSGPQRVP